MLAGWLRVRDDRLRSGCSVENDVNDCCLARVAAVDIDPRILRAMWRQLCRERGLARRPLQPAAPPVIALIHPAASS